MRLCFEAKNWDALNENIVLLTKKRGQIKQVLLNFLITAKAAPHEGVNRNGLL